MYKFKSIITNIFIYYLNILPFLIYFFTFVWKKNFHYKIIVLKFKIKIIKVLLENQSEKFRSIHNFSDNKIWI